MFRASIHEINIGCRVVDQSGPFLSVARLDVLMTMSHFREVEGFK